MMFKEWGFLITEMVFLLILAALLGLFAGWIVWGRARNADAPESRALSRLRADLEACRVSGQAKDRRIGELENRLVNGNDKALAAAAGLVDGNEIDFEGDGRPEGTGEGVKPAVLAAPREGGADDLKKISGVGPKLEQLCHALGVYHFDQIAGWSDQEVAWVDANLEGFRGRVTRDGWVAQARELAGSGGAAVSRPVDEGDVYG